jgi:uncharacterized membrane protein
MTTKNPFSQVAQKLKRADRGFGDPALMSPGREWLIGLVIAVVIFVLGAIWGIQTYLMYRTTTTSEVTPVTEETVIYRESLVETALTEFAERKREHERLLENSKQESEVLEKVDQERMEETPMSEEEVATSSETTEEGDDGEEEELIATTTVELVE